MLQTTLTVLSAHGSRLGALARTLVSERAGGDQELFGGLLIQLPEPVPERLKQEPSYGTFIENDDGMIFALKNDDFALKMMSGFVLN